MSYARIVVGTDGSEPSLVAVGRAAELAASEHAELEVVCAYHPMRAREQARVTTGLDDTRRRVTGTVAAQQALDAALRRAESAGATVHGRLAEGDAVETILAAAKQSAAELVVVGSTGINSIKGRLLGSVPSLVVHRATCDVLIVYASDT
ncbi:MAG TPA: universal stress protein [Dermatophilaceae bacterium]|nr:universal stress protein [Dermatophilaceae bacterium]